MSQAGVSRSHAVRALRHNDNDVVNALMVCQSLYFVRLNSVIARVLFNTRFDTELNPKDKVTLTFGLSLCMQSAILLWKIRPSVRLSVCSMPVLCFKRMDLSSHFSDIPVEASFEFFGPHRRYKILREPPQRGWVGEFGKYRFYLGNGTR